MTPEERLAELGHELPAPNPRRRATTSARSRSATSSSSPATARTRTASYVFKGKLGREVDVADGPAGGRS